MGKFEYSLGLNEFKSKELRLWQALIGEFIGNLILNFFACGACTQPQDDTFKALAFGLGVFMAITVSVGGSSQSCSVLTLCSYRLWVI